MTGVSPGVAHATPITSEQVNLWPSWHLLSTERKAYQRNGQALTITLAQLADPTYAYCAYTFLRPVPATNIRPVPHSSVGQSEAMLLIGNLLVDVTGANLPPDAKDLATLAEAIQPHASNMPYPSLWESLPADNFYPHSDRYAIDPPTLHAALDATWKSQASSSGVQLDSSWPSDDWLGFNDEVEAETGLYRSNHQTALLIVASYPTPQVATDHLQAISQWFAVNPTPHFKSNRPVLFARQVGSLVAFAYQPGASAGEAGAPSVSAALLGQIHSDSLVTWDEPAFKLTDRTMPEYIVGIILGTMTLLMGTLVAGIALGFIRVGVKHYLPGVVFDRRRSVEIIQLGLTTKPIRSEDFYG